jgi:importin subunit beta-1
LQKPLYLKYCPFYYGFSLNKYVSVIFNYYVISVYLFYSYCIQEEDADEDDWNVAMAAGTCLSLLAQCVEDAIVAPVIPFVESHIRNADWRYREAAIMAFGSILEGPDHRLLANLVNQALPVLIDMMKDSSAQVKDTTAWTLGRVSDLLIECIKPDDHLQSLVSALVLGLRDSQRIVSNCCWVCK